MKEVKDITGRVLEVGDIIGVPIFGRIEKSIVLGILESPYNQTRLKLSCSRDVKKYGISGIYCYKKSWHSERHNITEHNSYIYKYLSDFIILDKESVDNKEFLSVRQLIKRHEDRL